MLRLCDSLSCLHNAGDEEREAGDHIGKRRQIDWVSCGQPRQPNVSGNSHCTLWVSKFGCMQAKPHRTMPTKLATVKWSTELMAPQMTPQPYDHVLHAELRVQLSSEEESQGVSKPPAVSGGQILLILFLRKVYGFLPTDVCTCSGRRIQRLRRHVHPTSWQ